MVLEARDKTGIVWQVDRTLPVPETCLLDGRHFKLSDYRGKVVVLDFWGHW